VNCDGMYICNNRKCINQTKVCDGKNDCNDRSDENICTAENFDYNIRLAGTNNSYEGRIEVKSKYSSLGKKNSLMIFNNIFKNFLYFKFIKIFIKISETFFAE